MTKYFLSAERRQHRSVTAQVWSVVSGSRWHSGCLRKVCPEVIERGALYQALGEEGGTRSRREKANDTQKAKRCASGMPVSSPLFLPCPLVCPSCLLLAPSISSSPEEAPGKGHSSGGDDQICFPEGALWQLQGTIDQVPFIHSFICSSKKQLSDAYFLLCTEPGAGNN